MDPNTAPPPSDPTVGAAGAPPTTEAGAPSDDVLERFSPEARARYTELGRRAAAAEARTQEVAAQNAYLNQQIQGIQGYLSQQQQAAYTAQQQATEAQIQQLPPDERAEARVQLLSSELTGLRQYIAQRDAAQQRPTQQATRQPSEAEYVRGQAQDWIDDANRFYGLAGDDAMQLTELTAAAGESSKAFTAAVQALAKKKLEQGENMARTSKKPAPGSVDAQVAERVDKRLQELGVGAPHSARPTASSGGPTSSEELNKLAWDKSLTPAQRAKAFRGS